MIAALRGLLARAAIEDVPVVAADDTGGWPPGTVEAFVNARLLAPMENDRALRCDGCEEGCLVTPIWRRDPGRAGRLVHWCHHEREIGLVDLDARRLRRWRADLDAFADWLSRELRLLGRPTRLEGGHGWRLGERTLGGTRRRIFLVRGSEEATAIDDPVALVLTLTEAIAPAIAVDAVLVATVRGLAVDDALLEGAVVRPRRSARVKPLDLADGTRWEQVIVRVVGDEEVELVTPQRTPLRLGPEALGMRDQRNGEPTEAWGALLVLARGGGELAMGDKGSAEKLSWQVGTLRKALQAAIPAQGTPIPDYRKTGGKWRTTFILSDQREPAEFSRSPRRP